MIENNDTGPLADREWLVNQIAHALRNPIFAAMVQSESLLLRADQADAVARTAEMLRGQLKRLSDNIDEMLLFGRPIRASFQEVQVAGILSSLATRYANGERQDPAAIETTAVDPQLCGTWDRGALVIILERLLDNAVQHTEAPHEIRLSASAPPGGVVEFAVVDRGHGIPDDLMGQIMLPFFPQHSGRPGLGLAIASKFARSLGGRIVVDSVEGQGTTARCILPISPISAESA